MRFQYEKMRYHLFVFISIVLCFTAALFMTSFTTAFAAQTNPQVRSFEGKEHLFGSQLNEEEIYFYFELFDGLKVPTEEILRIAPEDIKKETMQNSFWNALSALLQDFPEYEWIQLGGNGSKLQYMTSQDGGLVRIEFVPVISYEFTSAKNILEKEAKTLEEVKQIIEDIPKSSNSRYARLQYVHDYLVKTITYDSTLRKPEIRSTAGALLNRECVCEGYAKAFKQLCDAMAIPNQLVISKQHMWNQVQMENGQWYVVDVTYDDPIMMPMNRNDFTDGSNLSYQFFLKGSQTMKNSMDHRAIGNFSSNSKAFTYMPLAQADYSPADAKPEALVTHYHRLSDWIFETVKQPVFGVTKKTIYVGGTYQQKIDELLPGAKIAYQASDSSIAKVSKTGKITAVKAGSTVITVKVEQGGETYTHTIHLTVKKPYLKFVKSKTALTVKDAFKFVVKKYGVSDKVTWSVNDTLVATISKWGTLTAKKSGKVTVTAKAGTVKVKVVVKITK